MRWDPEDDQMREFVVCTMASLGAISFGLSFRSRKQGSEPPGVGDSGVSNVTLLSSRRSN